MKLIARVTVLFIFVGLLSFTLADKPKQDPDFLKCQNAWVDSVFNSLTPDQRLAQLFMVAAYSNRDMKHVREIKELITQYNIGGLIWMQGGPVRQGILANYYQSIAKTPLLYSIDGEWGLSMRLDSTVRYPRQMTLGAIQNDSLIYLMGRQIAKECKRLGIHINFAPVADVNNNPANPVIGMRSFGENKWKVAQKSLMYVQGLQDEHVMANAKHFPGHGDTESDSHLSLPLIPHSITRLDTLELYPFQYLFDRGLASIMVAHLNIPSLDTAKNMASTLSPKVVNDLLKTKMNFKGLVFTDALNMKGAADLFEPGIVDLKALLAGNDVLLFSGDVPKAIVAINQAVTEGKISREEIDARCKKVLQAKYWCGLNVKPEIPTLNLYKDLNTALSDSLNRRLAQAAITVLKNENSTLPFKLNDTAQILALSFGNEEVDELLNECNGRIKYKHFGLSHDAKDKSIQALFEKVNAASSVLIQINKSNMKPDKNFGVSEQTFRLIDSIAKLKPSTLVLFSNPYLMNLFNNLSSFKAIVLAYENTPFMMQAAARVLMGNAPADGQLPVTTKWYKAGDGLSLNNTQNNLPPKTKAIKKKTEEEIDSIVKWGIEQKAYPGCQIIALRNGEIIFQKSYGKYTYAHDAKHVNNKSIYDIASVTKIAASALALMKLASEGKFDYKKTLGDYLPELKGSNKEKLLIEDILCHRAGLPAWLPFYQNTLAKNNKYKPGYYQKHASDDFPNEVAHHLFAVKGIQDSIYKQIVACKLDKPGEYVYSDLGYYFMQRIIEKLSWQALNRYVAGIYQSFNCRISYQPLSEFDKDDICPTENDKIFRKQQVRGYVHDPGAAMMGGVAGHAGLFANAEELAKVMELFLNKGMYQGKCILDSNVVKDYTRCHFCPNNRRGLCFEKPETNPKKDSPVTAECSPESFGHAGFTGTLAWADPKNKLVFVFLSNRVYPDAEVNKLAKLGIRGKIHSKLYEWVNTK
jgi:beta-glucosidase-like glycosyl hydrolase/CubicO group peptidase (beta-lactamase class C family)